MTRHLIRDIHFTRGVPDADSPMTCSCGEWSGRLGDWLVHKRPDARPPIAYQDGCRHGHPPERRFRNSAGWADCRDCHQDTNRRSKERRRATCAA